MQRVLKGDRTKHKLADALKALLNTKPLERIRVHDLTDPCDIHRQTFYYHFVDVYALFTYCVQLDAAELSVWLGQFPSWQEALNSLLRHISENRGYFSAILEHLAPHEKQAFFDKILSAIVDHIRAEALSGQDGILPPPCLRSLPLVLLTLLEGWIREELPQSPADIVGFLEQFSGAPAAK